jgi:hypothetical protein
MWMKHINIRVAWSVFRLPYHAQYTEHATRNTNHFPLLFENVLLIRCTSAHDG